MRRVKTIIATFLWIGSAACQPAQAPVTTAEGETRAEAVGLALQAFDASAFDTIMWPSDDFRAERGGLVFRISCEKCHGLRGAGDGNFVAQGDTLKPPSFVAEDWSFAERPMRLRRYVFSGSVEGMPYWGLVGLNYRDIDAVAYFIEAMLRAEVGTP